MGAYLEALEALHAEMIAGLLGRNMGGAVVTPVNSPAPVVAAPQRVKATCARCGKKLRAHSVGELCRPCREAQLPAKLCADCNSPVHAGNKSGYCLSCGIKRGKAAKRAAAPAPEPEPAPTLAIAALQTRLCTLCSNTLRGDNLTGICSECRKKRRDVVEPFEITAQRSTTFVEGDRVRITAAKHDHPFAKGDVVQVVEIEKQDALTWYKVRGGRGFWHNFREQDLELVQAKEVAA